MPVPAHNSPYVLPVSAQDALLWLDGRIRDLDLVLRAQLRPEAVWIATCPNLRAYRAIRTLAAYWRSRGAVCAIFRTANPIVADHALALDPVIGIREPGSNPVEYRFLLPPASFQAWLARPRHRGGCCHSTPLPQSAL